MIISHIITRGAIKNLLRPCVTVINYRDPALLASSDGMR